MRESFPDLNGAKRVQVNDLSGLGNPISMN